MIRIISRRLRGLSPPATPVCMLALAALLGLASHTLAAQWPTYHGDNQRTGRVSFHLTHEPIATVVFRTGSGCSASPVIGPADTIYYGAYDRGFYTVWPGGSVRFPTTDMIVATSAIADDGSVYFGTSGGALYALNGDGTAKWSSPLRVGLSSLSGSVLIGDNGLIYFTSDAGYVYCADAATGSLKWSVYAGGQLRYGLAASPDGSVLYAPSSDGYVYAVNTNGTLKWKSKNAVSPSNAPAVGDDGTIYVGGTDRNLYALKPDGTQKWARQVYAKVTTTATIGFDGTIYFGSADLNLYALRPDGSIKWTYWVRETVYSAPIIDSAGQLIFGTPSGNVMAFNAATGALSWTRALGTGIYSSPAASWDGSIYVLDGAGTLSRLSGPVSPEPSSLAALAAGIAFAAGVAIRKRRSA